MIINTIGATVTAIVALVFAVTKFTQGAWIVLLLVPLMVALFFRIHRHYCRVAERLSLTNFAARPVTRRHRVILPISGVHQGTINALHYAQLLSDDVTAVHISIDAAEAEKLEEKWDLWGEGVRLVVLNSPYRLMLDPLLQYIEQLSAQCLPNETITVVVPQFVTRHWFGNLLHTQTAMLLRLALLFKPGIVVTDVPYQLD
jgi:hypothetical protein